MPKANTLYDELLANAQQSTKPHPLEDVIHKIFADKENTDLCLTQIATDLGACSHPKRGWDARPIVMNRSDRKLPFRARHPHCHRGWSIRCPAAAIAAG
jgi:hypothetical protein